MLAKAKQVLALLDASHLADKPVEEMSSGEARRMLHRARPRAQPRAPCCSTNPPPASTSSPSTNFAKLVRKLAVSGIGILLVTHHLSDIIPEIERVIFMRQGRVVADGPKREILTAAALRELFGVEAQLAERDGYYHLW